MLNQIHVYAHMVHGRRSLGLGVKGFICKNTINIIREKPEDGLGILDKTCMRGTKVNDRTWCMQIFV